MKNIIYLLILIFDSANLLGGDIDSVDFRNDDSIVIQHKKHIAIPDELYENKNLKYLCFEFCTFSHPLDERIERLNLETLILYGCELLCVPQCLFAISDLKLLDLGMNNFDSLPDKFDNFENLKFLRLSHIQNESFKFPYSIFKMESLEELELEYIGLDSLPEGSYKLPHLCILKLGTNHIPKIPKWFVTLKNLKVLDLGGNDITIIENLPKRLVALDLSLNKIEEVPEHVLKLKHLRFLEINQNQIEKFPIVRLRLEELRLGRNKIPPEDIKALRNLNPPRRIKTKDGGYWKDVINDY